MKTAEFWQGFNDRMQELAATEKVAADLLEAAKQDEGTSSS